MRAVISSLALCLALAPLPALGAPKVDTQHEGTDVLLIGFTENFSQAEFDEVLRLPEMAARKDKPIVIYYQFEAFDKVGHKGNPLEIKGALAADACRTENRIYPFMTPPPSQRKSPDDSNQKVLRDGVHRWSPAATVSIEPYLKGPDVVGGVEEGHCVTSMGGPGDGAHYRLCEGWGAAFKAHLKQLKSTTVIMGWCKSATFLDYSAVAPSWPYPRSIGMTSRDRVVPSSEARPLQANVSSEGEIETAPVDDAATPESRLPAAWDDQGAGIIGNLDRCDPALVCPAKAATCTPPGGWSISPRLPNAGNCPVPPTQPGCNQVVIGYLTDTMKYVNCPGYIVLNTPDWSIDVNDGFVGCVARGGMPLCTTPVKLVSDPDMVMDRTNVNNRPRVTARELCQFHKCGCKVNQGPMTVDRCPPLP